MTRNRLFRGLLLMLALALCLTWVTGERVTAAAEDEELEIVSSYPYTTVARVKVNLRASRSVKSALLKRIPEGAEITVTEKNGNWAHVEYKGTKGWVRTEYIVLKTVKKIRVTPTPTPAPTLSPAEDAGGYIVLRRGSSGAEVQALQEALTELGFLKGAADGKFGETTEKAVIAFEQKNKYPDTGLVDANLQAFLYSGKPLNAKGEATKINTLSPAEGVTMRSGNTGEPVAQLQAKLKELGYYAGEITRKYDTATSAAVKAFQKTNSLKADGLAGAETRKLLDSGTALPADATPVPAATAEPTPTPEPVWKIPKSTVKNGSEGADAKTVQTRLKELGYYQGKVDGKFGRASMNALKNFQTNNGLKADGVAGKNTYEKLFSAAAVPYAVAETATPAPGEIPKTSSSATTESIVWKTLRSGDSGTEVKQLQENLIQMGYLSGKPDGKYGQGTVEAVKAFQKANNLTSDGTAGPATLKAVYSGTAKTTEKPADSAAAISGTLKRGSTGTDVKTLQTKLIELGFLTGKADGVFGRKTSAAVMAFQKANKLKADGVAGTKTLAQLEKSEASSAKSTPAATATPAPTPVPGAAEALSGRPSASRVIYANWYSTVKNVCKAYPYATVYDYSTGISWQVHIFSVGAHADCEPLTASDTAKMRRAFGNEETWTAKPVWVIFADGSVYMASTHDTPHGTSHISDNNFDGHTCIHFPRTQEQVTAIGPYATSHQETIDTGWAQTQRSSR